MEELREDLHQAIEKNGLDYEKLIEIDNKLHNEINAKQRKILEGTNV